MMVVLGIIGNVLFTAAHSHNSTMRYEDQLVNVSAKQDFMSPGSTHYKNIDPPLKFEDQQVNREPKSDPLPRTVYPVDTKVWESDEGWQVYDGRPNNGVCYIKHRDYDLVVTTESVTLKIRDVTDQTNLKNYIDKYAFLYKDKKVGILFTAEISLGTMHSEDDLIESPSIMFYSIDLDDPKARQKYFQEFSYLQFNEHIIDLTGSKRAWAKLQSCINDK